MIQSKLADHFPDCVDQFFCSKRLLEKCSTTNCADLGFVSGQNRGVFGAFKRALRRRSAIEPVIGHMKAEGHLGRCYLKGTDGDAVNAILTAVGHNFRLILAWLRILLCLILAALSRVLIAQHGLKLAS